MHGVRVIEPSEPAPLVVPSRYCGPPASGNGGFVSGSLAATLAGPGPVEVWLRRPPPLEEPMTVEAGDAGRRLLHGDALVAEARSVEAELDPVEPVSYAEAAAASPSYPGHASHPFPTCFACGPERRDGLGIFPGPVGAGADGRTRVAAPWTPDASLPTSPGEETEDGKRRVSPAVAWAALDCVGGWAGDLTERLMVLGRMTACIDALPVVGEPHVVMGQALGREGRRTMTASTLWDADGRVVGIARHVWVAVDAEAFSALGRKSA